ncbi:MAG: Rieske 2Fe-2S domain-containing protein [Proteobacteria bacterium]|nr:Rieske 2Fe-2S domain-containing protein [Pseudomonadota bacterium]
MDGAWAPGPPALRLGFQRARPGVLAWGSTNQLDEVVAGAGEAVGAAGEDVAVLRRKDLDAAAVFARCTHDGCQPRA